MSSSVFPFKNQRYADLKRDCIKRKRLFRDPEFPADDSSMFYKEPPPDRDRRPPYHCTTAAIMV
uniref:Uncharacterized protein n=1 Tax=Oryzias latipes TaxID=8090 RepID=A0A3P9J861_ORYLA